MRYNPEGDATLNRRQADRLKRLSGYLHDKSASRLMFELLVPPEKAELEEVGGDRKAYDHELRPRLMVRAIHELQDAGVEPDLWKIEGLDARTDCGKVVEAARRGGRDKVSCIVLGRGEDDQKVREWLSHGGRGAGFHRICGRPDGVLGSLVGWRAGKSTREAAVAEVARRYREFVDVFEKGAPREAASGSPPVKPSVLKRESPMQLGMIGLGRMGANMVRRLIKGGHQCVVFDMSPKAVQELVQEKAVGSSSLADFVKKLDKPRAVWLHGAGGGGGQDHRRPPAARSRRATSSSTAATRTTSTTSAAPRSSAPKGIHYVDVGTSGGVWGLERGYCMMIGGEPDVGEAPRPDLRHARSRRRRHRPHAGTREGRRHRRSRAICTADRTAPATSSRWSTTASSTASWPPTPKGWASCAPPTSASRRTPSTPRRRRCAIPSTTSTTSTCPTSPRCGGAAA